MRPTPMTDTQQKAEAMEHGEHPKLKRPIWRLPICWLQLCGYKTQSDDSAIWGECTTCGHRAGQVSRDELRAYADREIDRALRTQDQGDQTNGC